MCLLFLGSSGPCFKGQVLSFQKQLLMSQEENHLVQEFFLQTDAFKKEKEFLIIPRFPFEAEESCSTKSINLVLSVSPVVFLPIQEGTEGGENTLERKGIGRWEGLFVCFYLSGQVCKNIRIRTHCIRTKYNTRDVHRT